jgi:cation transport regulator ChaB
MTKQYKTLDDLPKKIKQELSAEAQELYVAVYRRTWEECHMAGEATDSDLAETAHGAAMLAVESKFEKRDGQWHSAPVGSEIESDKLRQGKH